MSESRAADPERTTPTRYLGVDASGSSLSSSSGPSLENSAAGSSTRQSDTPIQHSLQDAFDLQTRLTQSLSAFLNRSPRMREVTRPQTVQIPDTDRRLLRNFCETPSNVFAPWCPPGLSFHNLLADLACEDLGTMHCLLSMSGALLVAKDTGNGAAGRGAWHFDQAFQYMLVDDKTKNHKCNAGGAAEQVLVARALLVCIRFNILSETYASSAAYRIHWNAITHVSFDCHCQLPSTDLAQLVKKFIKFYGLCHILGSLPGDQWVDGATYVGLPACFSATEPELALAREWTDWTALEGTFSKLAQINSLRGQVRTKRASGESISFDENLDMMQLDAELAEQVEPKRPPEASVQRTYCASARVYLLRTMLPPRQHPHLRRCTDQSLDLLEATLRHEATPLILSMLPLFLTACAAFEAAQRSRVVRAYRRMNAQAALTITVARVTNVLAEVWRLMDSADAANWDWEQVASGLSADSP